MGCRYLGYAGGDLSLAAEAAFGPEDVKRLVDAYERALVALRLKDRNDPVTETVAKLIIEAAQTGEKDPVEICALALKCMWEQH